MGSGSVRFAAAIEVAVNAGCTMVSCVSTSTNWLLGPGGTAVAAPQARLMAAPFNATISRGKFRDQSPVGSAVLLVAG